MAILISETCELAATDATNILARCIQYTAAKCLTHVPCYKGAYKRSIG